VQGRSESDGLPQVSGARFFKPYDAIVIPPDFGGFRLVPTSCSLGGVYLVVIRDDGRRSRFDPDPEGGYRLTECREAG
jgi:hypothetical protein